jgi:hypothetical protein
MTPLGFVSVLGESPIALAQCSLCRMELQSDYHSAQDDRPSEKQTPQE